MTDAKSLLTIQELAKTLDRSEQAIRNWVKEGLAHERIDDRMRFDLDGVIEWLDARDKARRKKSGRPPANPVREAEDAAPGAKDSVELRKIIAQTRLLELRAGEMEGRLVSQELPEKAVAAQAYAIRQQAIALPRILTHALSGKTDPREVEEIIRTHVDQMLTTLADTDLEKISLQIEQDGRDEPDPTDE